MDHEAARDSRRLSLVRLIMKDAANLWIVESCSPAGGRDRRHKLEQGETAVPLLSGV